MDGMRILIADDESVIRMGLKAILQGMGHTIIEARNGREALQMARRHTPEMAILDIKMPYTDGIQASKTIAKSMPIPVILLTAFTDDDLIEKASDMQIHGYLVKPVEPQALKAAIAVAQKRFADQMALVKSNIKLQESLETRKLVDRAKGKLMVDKGLNEQDAYRLLQLRARESRISMKDVAQAILQG